MARGFFNILFKNAINGNAPLNIKPTEPATPIPSLVEPNNLKKYTLFILNNPKSARGYNIKSFTIASANPTMPRTFRNTLNPLNSLEK